MPQRVPMAERGPAINGENLKELVLDLPQKGKGALNQDTEQKAQTTATPFPSEEQTSARHKKKHREGWSTIPAEVSEHTASGHFLRRGEEHFYLEEINRAITKNSKRHISTSLDDTSYCVKETSK